MSVTLPDEARLEARVDQYFIAVAKLIASIAPHLPEAAWVALGEQIADLERRGGAQADYAAHVRRQVEAVTR